MGFFSNEGDINRRGGRGRAQGGAVMGYAKGGRTDFQRGKELTQQIAEVANVPGGLEMLTTMAAEELGVGEGKGSKAVRLFNMGGGAEEFGSGGLAQAAEQTRSGGRGDDEMLVHMSPEEYEAIESMWGKADINPRTGMPEYGFLSKIWKGIKNTVKKIVKSPLFSFIAPIALNVFAPGLGSAVGGWLGATGKAAATIGNTIVRSGLGAISGGKDGAISGALSGLTASGVGGDIGSKLGLGDKMGRLAGDALLGGVAGEATGVGFGQGAMGQAMQTLAGDPTQKMMDKLTSGGRDFFGTTGSGILGKGIVAGDDPMGMMSPTSELMDPFGVAELGSPPSGPMSPVPSGPQTDTVLGNIKQPGVWNKATDWMKEHPY